MEQMDFSLLLQTDSSNSRHPFLSARFLFSAVLLLAICFIGIPFAINPIFLFTSPIPLSASALFLSVASRLRSYCFKQRVDNDSNAFDDAIDRTAYVNQPNPIPEISDDLWHYRFHLYSPRDLSDEPFLRAFEASFPLDDLVLLYEDLESERLTTLPRFRHDRFNLATFCHCRGCLFDCPRGLFWCAYH
jgi:hypothetical protein